MIGVDLGIASLIGSKNDSFLMALLLANISLHNINSVGNDSLRAKDIKAHIEIY